MNNLSKLQSEAVLEFENKFFINNGEMKVETFLDAKQFLSDQIQKASSNGREEVL